MAELGEILFFLFSIYWQIFGKVILVPFAPDLFLALHLGFSFPAIEDLGSSSFSFSKDQILAFIEVAVEEEMVFVLFLCLTH